MIGGMIGGIGRYSTIFYDLLVPLIAGLALTARMAALEFDVGHPAELGIC